MVFTVRAGAAATLWLEVGATGPQMLSVLEIGGKSHGFQRTSEGSSFAFCELDPPTRLFPKIELEPVLISQ